MRTLRRSAIWFLLLLAAVTAGCRATIEDQADGPGPGIEGYVVKKEGESMLVVASDRNAIWFAEAPRETVVGQRVQVWFGEVRESYPAQAKADRVTIFLSPKPLGADLSEADAIRAALGAHASSTAPAIRQVEYDETSDAWSVTIEDENGENVERVKDEK